ncbi:hypothetical protein FIBSPDRAFT_1054258 [Athelia psychrophila]|uniref:Secreted protein n=1 Tax=Athelia psychrophila TaxID=1759441 RepID=A0A167VL97_9AGAM|nr:hypothetical protein FIBSPDRAFT_1054258 [Fibularhizoctonia sp. CBS 109695]
MHAFIQLVWHLLAIAPSARAPALVGADGPRAGDLLCRQLSRMRTKALEQGWSVPVLNWNVGALAEEEEEEEEGEVGVMTVGDRSSTSSSIRTGS